MVGKEGLIGFVLSSVGLHALMTTGTLDGYSRQRPIWEGSA